MITVKRVLGILTIVALLLSSAPLFNSTIPTLAQDAAGGTAAFNSTIPTLAQDTAGDCSTCSDSAGEGKAEGVPNPAAVYCKQLGYQYEIREDEEGNEYGVCIFPDGSEVNAWDFYNGECGQEYSYCAKQGYDIETERVDKGSYYTECAVCVSRRGAEEARIPMLELMEKNGEALWGTESYEMKEEDTDQDCVECEASRVEGTSKDQPAAFDWRDVDGHTYIGPIRDQGGCGSCYAFGAAASAEGVYNWATGNYDGNCADFSESFIVWCLGEYGA